MHNDDGRLRSEMDGADQTVGAHMAPSLIQSTASLPMLNSFGARLFGERWAVDLGAIYVHGVTIPIPWVDFVYNFGG